MEPVGKYNRCTMYSVDHSVLISREREAVKCSRDAGAMYISLCVRKSDYYFVVIKQHHMDESHMKEHPLSRNNSSVLIQLKHLRLNFSLAKRIRPSPHAYLRGPVFSSH